MSQENVVIVRAAVDAFNQGDWDAVLKDTTPEVELDFSRSMGPQRGIYERDQIRGFMDDLAENWEALRLEPHEFIETGGHVVVPWTFRVMGRDGIEVQARTTWVWTIRNGAIARITMYQRREEALEAAGLQE
jgi:ketosteroid isomerase-like protein